MPKFTKEIKETGRSPEDVATDLGEVYFIRKDAEDEQKKLRVEFFEAATEANSSAELARKTFSVTVPTEEEARTRTLKYNPGWRIVEVVSKDGFEVILEEDPEFMGYEATVRDPMAEVGEEARGWVVTKTIRSGSVQIDDARMKEEDPALYQAVTIYANADLYWDLANSFDIDIEVMDEWLAEQGVPMVMRPLEDLSEAELEDLQAYMYEGPKTIALNVKEAKPDDLAGL